MPDHSFVVVAVVAFLAPVTRELLRRAFVPAIVFELVGGMIVGPHVLGIADTTAPVELFAQVGLAALLSVIAFPAIAFRLLEKEERARGRPAAAAA